MNNEEPLDLSEMQTLQRALREAQGWPAQGPEKARDHLLWMVEELGEMAAILKKRGEDAVMRDPETRAHFLEEASDTVMYLNEVMLCFSVSPDEWSAAYRKKIERNMTRIW